MQRAWHMGSVQEIMLSLLLRSPDDAWCTYATSHTFHHWYSSSGTHREKKHGPSYEAARS